MGKREGGEITIIPGLNISGTQFYSGETSQALSNITIGGPFTNLSIENDVVY